MNDQTPPPVEYLGLQPVDPARPAVDPMDSALGRGVDEDPEPDDGAGAPDLGELSRALGRRLRAIRVQQRMSLRDVAAKSGGVWKAVVVGSYERGDRTISAARLAKLAGFYGVPLTELLPPEFQSYGDGSAEPAGHVIVDIEALAGAPEAAANFIRYARSVQRRRHDYGNRLLSLRETDLRALAALYDATVAEFFQMLLDWNVLTGGGARDLDAV